MKLESAITRCHNLGFTFSDNLIEVIYKVDRTLFVENKYQDQATMDRPLPIPVNQTISAPHMVLIMLAKESLDVQLGDIVLEIGTGSGYNTALLSYLVGEKGIVYTIERHKTLIDFAKNNLFRANIPNNYKIIHGDGTIGIQDHSFNKIIVTASGPCIPDALLDQLDEKGILLIPVKNKNNELLLKIQFDESSDKKTNEFLEKNSKYVGRLKIDDLGAVRFVPLIGEYGFEK